MELHPISISRLMHLEVGQFISSQLTGIRALGGPEIFTNEGLNDYLSELDTRLGAFINSLRPVRKSDETIKIQAQDKERDQAFIFLKKAAALFEISENAEEKDAALSLKILFSGFKNLSRLNYEAESRGIDNLLEYLGNTKYAPMVDLLGLGFYVSRLESSNSEFNRLFSGRNKESANQENFDTKLLKNEMLEVYNDFAVYVLSMAKLRNSPALFSDVLSLLNVNRKYYAVLLARRKGVAAEAV